ncbi:hypothetical protein [Flavobacterium soyangense]|uniref:Peptidase S24 n=1 Tax=Flavobacterium soyangense TaxID=2023265 RepID=A0A930Y219_9FLAO|nr:hypothetical protein [Flavobacterium soyangense]MBF2710059.1 hypothetical protein [Flavobacterium soyangense]
MGTTERVIKYLDFKGISKYKFCKDLGFSNKFLDNSSNMGTDKACKILHHYPEINAEWLLTGNGSMLKNGTNPIITYLHDNVEPVEQLNYKDLADARLQIIEMKDEKILRLEKELSELKYTQKEPFLYKNVAESAPELTKKEK